MGIRKIRELTLISTEKRSQWKKVKVKSKCKSKLTVLNQNIFFDNIDREIRNEIL